jgi:hypothetical protein
VGNGSPSKAAADAAGGGAIRATAVAPVVMNFAAAVVGEVREIRPNWS